MLFWSTGCWDVLKGALSSCGHDPDNRHLVLAIFIFPALAISWVVPTSNLSLTAGVMEAFDAFFGRFGISFLTPVFAILIVCAVTSSVLVWLDGPSKGLLLIGRQQGYLPPFFQRVNAKGFSRTSSSLRGSSCRSSRCCTRSSRT